MGLTVVPSPINQHLKSTNSIASKGMLELFIKQLASWLNMSVHRSITAASLVDMSTNMHGANFFHYNL